MPKRLDLLSIQDLWSNIEVSVDMNLILHSRKSYYTKRLQIVKNQVAVGPILSLCLMLVAI